MIETIKGLLKRASDARSSGERSDAERLYKEAAAKAAHDESVERAEALTGIAQARREAGDRTGAAIYYSEAITLLRNANAAAPLAHALRHAAEVRSEMQEYGVASIQIDEAIRLYRGLEHPEPLHLANALRVSALNDERQAQDAWTEALALYRAAGIEAGIHESEEHLAQLKSVASFEGATRVMTNWMLQKQRTGEAASE
jgi:tetratricopeptide (TPR) repeat protein